jgi:hypothetical protein
MFLLLDQEGIMATLIAQARRVSGFFRKLAHQLYDAGLARAERELKRHRPFLDH